MPTAEEPNNLPPCRVLLRSKDGVEVFSIEDSSAATCDNTNTTTTTKERKFLVEGGTSIQRFAPDGSCVYLLLSGHGVVKCPLGGNTTMNDDETSSGPINRSNTEPFLSDSASIQMMDISPKGTYLLTWERSSEQRPNNLRVWCAQSGQFIHGFPQKVLKREGWPYLQWTSDEKYAFLMATNEVRVFPGKSFQEQKEQQQQQSQLQQQNNNTEIRYIGKCRCPGMTSMSLPRSGNTNTTSYLFTSFCPKSSKDKPARASLHQYTPPPSSSAPNNNDGNNNNNNNKTGGGGGPYPALLSKSLFQAEEMKVHWSPKGDAALITLQTSVDTSGQSYYGSATLYLLLKDATDVVTVPLPQEGPVLDVQWMPNPNKPSCFVVIAGKMPAMASLHNGNTGEPLFLFGNAHRNTISWSSHGRFVCIAGFGNLAGNMSFWDRNKLKLIPPTGTNTANCAVGYGWAPDSRTFGVSSTYPRRTVENGFSLYRYNGEPIQNVPWNNQHYHPDKLFEAAFVPSLLDVYPDRPQSPQRAKQQAETDDTSGATTTTATGAPDNKSKGTTSLGGGAGGGGGRYVPPSARGRTGGTSLAERMRKEKEGNMQGATKVTTSKPGIAMGVTGQKIPGLSTTPVVQAKSKSALKREREKLKKQRKAEEEASKADAKKQEEAQAQEAAAADPEKRARKLKKALKQIEDLKLKDPSSLNPDQKMKIETESELRQELANLEL